mgnify:CR=1 FL=1
MKDTLRLGKHQSISIGASTTWTPALRAGVYEIIAKGAGCHVGVLANGSTVVDTTYYWLGAGDMKLVEIKGSNDPNYSEVFVGVIRDAAGGTGTLHVNRVDDEYSAG